MHIVTLDETLIIIIGKPHVCSDVWRAKSIILLHWGNNNIMYVYIYLQRNEAASHEVIKIKRLMISAAKILDPSIVIVIKIAWSQCSYNSITVCMYTIIDVDNKTLIQINRSYVHANTLQQYSRISTSMTTSSCYIHYKKSWISCIRKCALNVHDRAEFHVNCLKFCSVM